MTYRISMWISRKFLTCTSRYVICKERKTKTMVHKTKGTIVRCSRECPSLSKRKKKEKTRHKTSCNYRRLSRWKPNTVMSIIIVQHFYWLCLEFTWNPRGAYRDFIIKYPLTLTLIRLQQRIIIVSISFVTYIFYAYTSFRKIDLCHCFGTFPSVSPPICNVFFLF